MSVSLRSACHGSGLPERRLRGVRITILTYGTPNKILMFRPDNDTFDAMALLRERDGVPFSQQIRRALRAWLESKGVTKSERKRAATRKRP